MDSSDEDESSGSGEETQVRIPLGHPAVVFALPGSRDIATKTLAYLGWKAGQYTFSVFPNGEIFAKVEQSVTNHDVFVFCARDDSQSEVNFSLMHLLFFVNALSEDSPFRITVILPCLDYARQDRRVAVGEAIPPVLLLRCLTTAGASRFLTIDLHNEAEAAFTPGTTVLDELTAQKYLADFIRKSLPSFDPETVCVCATDGGGLTITRRMADELRTGIMVADRVRGKSSEADGQKSRATDYVKIMSSSTDSVRAVVIVDDLFDTCGTLVGVCSALREACPKAKIYAVATHGYFSGDAHLNVKTLVETYGLEWIAVTNTVTQEGPMRRFADAGIADRLKIVDISRLLAGAISRVHLGQSVNVPKFKMLGPWEEDPTLLSSFSRVSTGSMIMRHDDGTSPYFGAAPMSPPPPMRDL